MASFSDCGKLKSEGARKLYGMEIPSELFKKELVVGSGRLSAEQYRKLQRVIYGTREVGLLMQPVDGMLLYLPKFLEDGDTVVVVTSRDEAELEIAKEWCGNHGLSLEFVGVGYGGNKAQAVTGLDVYVDDDLDKLEPFVGVVPQLFLFSWGYNQHVNEAGIATRVSSWSDLYARIRALGDRTESHG